MPVILHQTSEAFEREYQQVRAALIAQGSSLNAWLHARGINRQLAYKALKGRSFGPKARALRASILVDVIGKAA